MKKLHKTLKTAALIGLLVATTSFAADDGGGRSVFARGAGERALAMGGAYGAVADGPTALFWNPAGLGRVDRTAFGASHTNLIGLGFYEQFGAAALSNWRMGTFGLALRRFGVDGIEGRDDRGALLDDNLQNTESELSFGYGRSLGDAWQLGAAVKIQNQETANQSGTALGLDLGVQARPLLIAGLDSPVAHAMSLGLTFRNVVEPTIRLAEDDVRDPASIRIGAAAEFPVARHVEVLLATDIDKTSDMDLHVHAGAEVRLMKMLALRGGTNNGALAAGAGLKWRRLTVNYAFEDNPLETVHRFGLGVAIGQTVNERRQAALDQQENELRQRLDAAFGDENTRRLQHLVTLSQTALAQGDFDQALRQVTTLRVLDPTHAQVDALEASAYLGQAQAAEEADDGAAATIAYRRCLAIDPQNSAALDGLAKLNAEDQRRAQRTQEIRDLFDQGLVSYAAGDLVAARHTFLSVLELDPEDTEARSLLVNTETTLRLRAESLAEQAAALATAGRYDQARAILENLRELVPGHAALARVQKQIQTVEADQRRAQQAATTPARPVTDTPLAAPTVASAPAKPSYERLSAERQAEVEDLYRRGVAAAEAGRRDDAISYWELVWKAAPDYQQVGEYLKQEYLARGMESFAAGQLDRSIEIWEQALAIDPGDARTQGYLKRAYEHKTHIREIRSSTS